MVTNLFGRFFCLLLSIFIQKSVAQYSYSYGSRGHCSTPQVPSSNQIPAHCNWHLRKNIQNCFEFQLKCRRNHEGIADNLLSAGAAQDLYAKYKSFLSAAPKAKPITPQTNCLDNWSGCKDVGNKFELCREKFALDLCPKTCKICHKVPPGQKKHIVRARKKSSPGYRQMLIQQRYRQRNNIQRAQCHRDTDCEKCHKCSNGLCKSTLVVCRTLSNPCDILSCEGDRQAKCIRDKCNCYKGYFVNHKTNKPIPNDVCYPPSVFSRSAKHKPLIEYHTPTYYQNNNRLSSPSLLRSYPVRDSGTPSNLYNYYPSSSYNSRISYST